MPGFDLLEDLLHPLIEFFGVEDAVIAPAVHDEGRDMPRHRRPVDVRLHRLAEPDGVARKQQEAAEALDLVELEPILGRAGFNPVFLHQKRHEIAAIPLAVTLNPANLVEIRRQNAGIGVAHTGKSIGFVGLDVALDQRLTGLDGPFVHAAGRIVDVSVKKDPVVRVIHDLTDRRAGAFRHHAVDHAFTLCHPGAGKPHRLQPPRAQMRNRRNHHSIGHKKANKLCLFNVPWR